MLSVDEKSQIQALDCTPNNPTERNRYLGGVAEPSFGDSNEPVSSVAEVMVASGGAVLAKSLQLVAIAGTAKAVEPATDSASRAKRGNILHLRSSLQVSPPFFRLPMAGYLSQLLALWQICLDLV